MTNGGTGPYKGKIIFMNQGRGSLPANMVLVDPQSPANAVSFVLLSLTPYGFFAYLFNSTIDCNTGQLLRTSIQLP